MVDSDHTCHTISINTLLPHKKWRENYLNCRTCKRSLVVLLGNFFLQNASEYLASHQSMYIAGAFENDIADTVWFVTQSNSLQPHPSFSCNAEETDTRLWVHVRKTDCTKILVMSPDTDVFIIGLALQSTRK